MLVVFLVVVVGWDEDCGVEEVQPIIIIGLYYWGLIGLGLLIIAMMMMIR
jgi:hypothetical protein